MRIIRTRHILSVVTLAFAALAFPHQTLAVTLTPLLSHDGLTIEQPLTLSSMPADDMTMSLSFGRQEEVAVTTPSEPEVLAEAIVVPTITVERTTIVQSQEVAQPIPTKVQKTMSMTSPTAMPTTSNKPASASPTPIKSGPTQAPLTITPQPTTTTSIQLSNGGLNADKLFGMTNTYRQSKGLPPVQKDDRVCQVAASRAPEISAEIAEGRMHSGIRARNLPYWNSEIIITMRTEEEAFNWWINDTIHREAIEGNYTYSCTACHGNACVQEFTNFQSK
jgi:uncharacterized protein YkwD